MRNILTVGVLIFIFSPLWSQIYIDPGIGAVFKDNTGNLSPRINMGIHNLVFNRLGVYGTLEVARTPGAKLIKETDERDIFGGIFRINNVLSVYGGAGMFSNGLLSNGFTLKGVRKEAGISLHIPSARLNIDLGYSVTNGISANLGFVIPMSKSRKADNKTTPKTTSPPQNESIAKGQDQSEVAKPVSAPTPAGSKTSESDEPSESLSDPIDLGKLKTSGSKPEAAQPAPDSENLTPGVYAINGVFRYRRNAQDELRILNNAGFPKARIGFRASTGLYYVWLLYSTDEEEIKDFVFKNRANGKLTGVWMMRVK